MQNMEEELKYETQTEVENIKNKHNVLLSRENDQNKESRKTISQL